MGAGWVRPTRRMGCCRDTSEERLFRNGRPISVRHTPQLTACKDCLEVNDALGLKDSHACHLLGLTQVCRPHGRQGCGLLESVGLVAMARPQHLPAHRSPRR